MAAPRHLVGVEKAALVAGVSRWTIGRKIKAGELSCTRDPRGRARIDLAELARVFDLTPAEITARTVAHRGARTGHATEPHGAHGAEVQAAEDRAAEAAAARLEADLRRERERVATLEAELRAARADAAAWADRFARLAERALLTDQRPDRPATETPREPAAPPPPPPKAATPDPAPGTSRPPRDPEGAIEAAARAILGDQFPDLVFGRRRR